MIYIKTILIFHMLFAEAEDEIFLPCKGVVGSYGAAWLGKMSMMKDIRFPRKWTRLEDASFVPFHTFKRKGSFPLQFRDPRSFFSLHLSSWQRTLKHKHFSSSETDLENFNTTVLKRIRRAARRECLALETNKQSFANMKILGLVPFNVYSCQSNCNESQWIRDIGNSHSIANEETKLAILDLTLCSMLSWVSVVRVFVMRDQLDYIRNRFIQNSLLFSLNELGAAKRLEFVVNFEQWCDLPRMLPMCALNSLSDPLHSEFNQKFEFIYYSEDDIIARWQNPHILNLTLTKLRNNMTYFPPMRSHSRSCDDPVDSHLISIENTCNAQARRIEHSKSQNFAEKRNCNLR